MPISASCPATKCLRDVVLARKRTGRLATLRKRPVLLPAAATSRLIQRPVAHQSTFLIAARSIKKERRRIAASPSADRRGERGLAAA